MCFVLELCVGQVAVIKVVHLVASKKTKPNVELISQSLMKVMQSLAIGAVDKLAF